MDGEGYKGEAENLKRSRYLEIQENGADDDDDENGANGGATPHETQPEPEDDTD